MGILDRYQGYVDAFELCVAGDDWSRIGPFFTEDAVLIYLPEHPAVHRRCHAGIMASLVGRTRL